MAFVLSAQQNSNSSAKVAIEVSDVIFCIPNAVCIMILSHVKLMPVVVSKGLSSCFQGYVHSI